MNLYVETSAVLRWILDQPGWEEILLQIESASRVVSSHLTLLECERILARNVSPSNPGGSAAARAKIVRMVGEWTLFEIDAPIRERAGQPFPVEPLRTLDSLHLATVLELERAIGPITLLSCDERVVANARSLGIVVVP